MESAKRVAMMDCFVLRASLLAADAFTSDQMAAMRTTGPRPGHPMFEACKERAAELLGAREVSRLIGVPVALEVRVFLLEDTEVFVWTFDRAIAGRVPCGAFRRVDAGVLSCIVVYGRALLVGLEPMETVPLTLFRAIPSMTGLHAPVPGMRADILPQAALERCAACQRTGAGTLKCTACKCARYCNPACQRADWDAHRAACRAAAALARGEYSVILDDTLTNTAAPQPRSRAELFDVIENTLLLRKNRHREIGFEYNHDVRRMVVIPPRSIVQNAAGYERDGFPMTRTLDVTATVVAAMRTDRGIRAAGRRAFQLRVFRHPTTGMGPFPVPDELVAFVGGSAEGGHGMLVVSAAPAPADA